MISPEGGTGSRHNKFMPRLLPLFPLQLVAFPGSAIPLHIFEERYKLMVGEAEAAGSEFGIVLARDNGIMLVENKPLAQALYKSVEVGDSIPSKLYQAVAEILAVVFRAQAEVRRSDAERRSRNASGEKIGNKSAGPAARPGVTQ